jgi:hypothetical protein
MTQNTHIILYTEWKYIKSFKKHYSGKSSLVAYYDLSNGGLPNKTLNNMYKQHIKFRTRTPAWSHKGSIPGNNT